MPAVRSGMPRQDIHCQRRQKAQYANRQRKAVCQKKARFIVKTLLTKEEMQELTQQLVLIARQLDDGLITTEAAETRIAEMLNIKIEKESK